MKTIIKISNNNKSINLSHFSYNYVIPTTQSLPGIECLFVCTVYAILIAINNRPLIIARITIKCLMCVQGMSYSTVARLQCLWCLAIQIS